MILGPHARGRWRPAAFAAALLALAACRPTPIEAQPPAPPAAEASAYPGLLARLPDGRRINLRCSGVGAPTVILESGHGATSLAWSRVQPELAKTHRVCAYDRAGYGFSDPGPTPRDGAAIARDLDRALRAARINGPFILVGHSAGGLYVRLFANRRPREVVGMVLVETSVEHQDRRFADLLGPGAADLSPIRARLERCLTAAEQRALPSTDPALTRCTPAPNPDRPPVVQAARLAEAQRPSTWRAQISELDNLWTRTSDQISRGPQSYGDLPIIVLTAGDAYATAPEPGRSVIRRRWAELHAEIAARSTRGEARVVEGSGHMMILDRPEAIIDAVKYVTRRAG
ncbi:MAG: alpha/beta fold hydrolase [Phenylobacterium sp.]|uniref:alpha/beta fold hydrolase n=1 Tax=Phenylobacterium sp. TaxID=1871053 RepID=UPI00391AFC13